jgi:polyhydroxyalkanoate synthesis regulator protein
MAPGKMPGMGVYEEQIRQNMALFDRAMKMFSPFAYVRPEDASAGAGEPPPAPAAAPAGDDSLADLKRQMEAMQEQLAKLANKS